MERHSAGEAGADRVCHCRREQTVGRKERKGFKEGCGVLTGSERGWQGMVDFELYVGGGRAKEFVTMAVTVRRQRPAQR
jgi:hypothetical protein